MSRRRPLSGAATLALSLAALFALGVSLAASARQSARQVCFSNLARLAQATLLYVADNDGSFPPHQSPIAPYTCEWGADNANPWLRWPVVLEEYVPDRSVYLCRGVEIPGLGHAVATRPSWIATQPITTKGWPDGPCGSVWPPGWGGSVTDSAVQGPCLDATRFRCTVGAAIGELGGRRLSALAEPRDHVMWADSSRMWLKLGSVLWANACRVDCADLEDKADWANCPWSQRCGAAEEFATNPERRAAFARHDGGSNIAFLDGHVEWRSVDQMIDSYRAGKLKGLEPASATEGKPWYLR